MTVSTNPRPNPEARWPAVLALFAIVGLRLALPRSLAASPAWVPLVLVTLFFFKRETDRAGATTPVAVGLATK